MNSKPKIIAIFIALNAEKTLGRFYQDLPKGLFHSCLLFDDYSDDKTFKLATKLGIKSIQNSKRLGYGGNIKLALNTALKNGADIIVDIHPDGEYRASAIASAIKKIESGADFVLGNRFVEKYSATRSGMYIWKKHPLLLLSAIDRLILGIKIHDFHQGFRVYSRNMLEKINFQDNSNDYLFSFELIAQAAYNKFRVAEVPVETNYTGKKRGASLKNSIKYSLGTFKVLISYILARSGLGLKLFTPKNS